jgi:arabinofuranosyltransferase
MFPCCRDETSRLYYAPAVRTRARLGIGLGIVVAALAALAGFVLSDGDRIAFAHGLSIDSSSLREEMNGGGLLPVKLRFVAQGPLPVRYAVFVHADSTAAGACHASADGFPRLPTTQWSAGESIEHQLHVEVPARCPLGELQLWAGLYDPTTGARLRVIEPHDTGDRAFVGSIQVVAVPRAGMKTYSSAGLQRARRITRLMPWLPWLPVFLLAVALAASWPMGATRSDAPKMPRWQWLGVVVPTIAFVLGLLMVLEFVKDDAYISWRYAHNLIAGEGLVFNRGERLEGMTNFFWVLVLAPFEALGLDLFQVCELLGGALGLACVVLVARFQVWFNGARADLSQYWGALWLASSSSFVLYAKSGLEQPCAAFLPFAGAFVLYRARERVLAGERDARVNHAYLGAGLLLGAGCLTRPELHLIAILVGVPLVIDVLRARTIARAELACLAGLLAVTVPCHAFRLAYYGTLVPNTFYVKTGSDSSIWAHGLATILDMLQFNGTGFLLALSPLAFLERRRTLEKSVFAAVSLSFLLYYMRVGVDEMHWHRLYIPALPFLCVLAGLGAQNLVTQLVALVRQPRVAAIPLAALGWAGFGWLAFANLQTTYEAEHGFNGHGDLAGTYHPDLGKFLVRHERPGGLVAFQDMGSTPYYAPDLKFLDFFGLVDQTVAHARHDHGLHTFIQGDAEAQRAYDAEMREYFFARNPEWTILTVYTPRGQEQQVSDAFTRDPTGGSIGSAYRNNPVQFRLWDDRRFHQRYVPVRTWPRSSAYYLALWMRRDLWEQTPGEVVLDAPPAKAQQVLARFEGGLELLGHELDEQVLERHEAFITTWWRLPGPMPPDLTFFVHVTANGSQVPADHVPGDWMYPADRWRAGQILEDRILFQLPPEAMQAGDYRVYIGAYRRSTGERLAIVTGASDGGRRVLVGDLHVKPLRPLLHALIPRTDVAAMRAHPERIRRSSPKVSLAK